MQSLGTKCVKSTEETPFLESGCHARSDPYPRSNNDNDIKFTKRLKYAAYAGVALVTVSSGLVLLYRGCYVRDGGNNYHHVDSWSQADTAVALHHYVRRGLSDMSPAWDRSSDIDEPKLLRRDSATSIEQQGPGGRPEHESSSESFDNISGANGLGHWNNTIGIPRTESAVEGKGKASVLPPRTEESSSAYESSSDEQEGLETSAVRLTYDQAVAKGRKYAKMMSENRKGMNTVRTWTPQLAEAQGWKDYSGAMRNPTPNGVNAIMKEFSPALNTMRNMLSSDWRHTQAWKAGSLLKTTTPPTQAYYQSIINVEAGVIFALNSHGPKEQGPKQRPPVTRLPDLQHWSDVVFMDWMEAAGNDGKVAAGLGKVARCKIANKDSQNIVSKILQDVLPKALTHDKRKTYQPNTQDYYALLGTENGVGVAYLLSQHQKSLGWKIVDSIEVFYDNGVPYMEFNLKTIQIGSTSSGTAGSSSRSKGGGKGGPKDVVAGSSRTGRSSRIKRNLITPLNKRTPIPVHPFLIASQSSQQSKNSDNVPTLTYSQAVAKGRERQAQIDKQPSGRDEDASGNLESEGWQTEKVTTSHSFRTAHAPMTEILKKLGADNADAIDVSSTHQASGGKYNNLFDHAGTTIVAWENFGPEEKAKSKHDVPPKLSKWSDVPPKLSKWSDVTYSQWTTSATRTPQNLQYIFRTKISNKHFDNVADVIRQRLTRERRKKELAQLLDVPGLPVQPGSNDFLALLGTPLAGGPTRLLSGHKTSLGWKHIRGIYLSFQDNSYWMVLMIGPHPHLHPPRGV